jgi:hypothetical protein
VADRAETTKARRVLAHAKDSVKGFLDAFKTVREARNAAGAPTDEDQDLARAALVFAAAGLDSCIKHLIKESLQTLAGLDGDVAEKFDKFVRKVIQDKSPARLASALAAESPRQRLLESYIYDLTGSSLQSFDEVAKAAGALGISVGSLSKRKKELEEVFRTRNKIIHELDVKFEAQVGQRERNSRSKTQLGKDAKLLLKIGDEFVSAIEKKLEEVG